LIEIAKYLPKLTYLNIGTPLSIQLSTKMWCPTTSPTSRTSKP
jgi:hypothetical protein